VAEEVLERLGIGALAESRVDQLPTGLARLVEVGRALATRPHVLLLDEPASGQDEAETAALADLLRDLASDGMAVVLVEHDVDLVMQTCERIHVLDFGELLAVGTAAEIQSDPAVVTAYLGVQR
jgi:branched-chain amino acid transport system ATP-binding protein